MFDFSVPALAIAIPGIFYVITILPKLMPNQKHLSDRINAKPKIFLMHGDNDTIVSPIHLLEAKEYFANCGIKIKTKLFKNCEHRIPVEGTSLGLEFLRKNLL